MSENPNPSRCGNCGAMNPPGQEFCVNCGKPLTLAASLAHRSKEEAYAEDPDLIDREGTTGAPEVMIGGLGGAPIIIPPVAGET